MDNMWCNHSVKGPSLLFLIVLINIISVVPRMADEADPSQVLAAKNVGSRAAYRPAPRGAKRQFGSTES